MAKKGGTLDKVQVREEWLAAIQALLSEIRKWTAAARWAVTEERKETTEDLVGAYSTQVLRIKTPNGLLYVEPIGRDVIGADGRVDLYSWPSLHRLLLLRQQDQWRLKTESGVEWPEEWGKDTFVKLARTLTKTP